MSTKISKDDVKTPDQITQTLRKGFVWTTGHSKMVLGTLVAFVIIGVGASLMSYFAQKKEVVQQEKFYLIEKNYLDKKRGFEEASRAEVASIQAKDKKNAPPFDPAKKASGDLTKDYGPEIAGFQGFINEAPGTKAAQMAALNLSDIFSSYKKAEEALLVLQKVEKGLEKDDMLSALVWMQMGNIWADKSDCKSAVEKWQLIAGVKALAFAHDEAKLRMGLCYESMNDLAKAEQLFTEISQKEDQSTTDFVASKEAKKYLRLLKAKKNL